MQSLAMQAGVCILVLVCGIVLVLWGITLHNYIKRTRKPAPASLGYALFLFAAADLFSNPYPVFGFSSLRHFF